MNEFIDNKDGTVSDLTTGLMWQQEPPKSTMNWHEAIKYCSGLTLGGLDDWRLPTLPELFSLIDYSREIPAIDPIMGATKVSSGYWSSTTRAGYTDGAWLVGFYYGGVYGGYKSSSFYVRAVRVATVNQCSFDPHSNLICVRGPHCPYQMGSRKISELKDKEQTEWISNGEGE